MKEANKVFDPLEALTVREAAPLLRVSRPTVEKYIKARELPSVRIGRCRRIHPNSLPAQHTRKSNRQNFHTRVRPNYVDSPVRSSYTKGLRLFNQLHALLPNGVSSSTGPTSLRLPATQA